MRQSIKLPIDIFQGPDFFELSDGAKWAYLQYVFLSKGGDNDGTFTSECYTVGYCQNFFTTSTSNDEHPSEEWSKIQKILDMFLQRGLIIDEGEKMRIANWDQFLIDPGAKARHKKWRDKKRAEKLSKIEG